MTRNTAINIVRKDSSKTDEHCLFSDTIFFDRKNGLERLSSLESSTGSINGNPYYRNGFISTQKLHFPTKIGYISLKIAHFCFKIKPQKVLIVIQWAVLMILAYVHRRTFQPPVILDTFPISNMKNHLAENQNHRLIIKNSTIFADYGLSAETGNHVVKVGAP